MRAKYCACDMEFCMCEETPGSSSGRIGDSESSDPGSIPGPGANRYNFQMNIVSPAERQLSVWNDQTYITFSVREMDWKDFVGRLTKALNK